MSKPVKINKNRHPYNPYNPYHPYNPYPKFSMIFTVFPMVFIVFSIVFIDSFQWFLLMFEWFLLLFQWFLLMFSMVFIDVFKPHFERFFHRFWVPRAHGVPPLVGLQDAPSAMFKMFQKCVNFFYFFF